jgi:leucyl-tRNA synthetase
MTPYNHSEIEKKWQKIWEDQKVFAAQGNSKDKRYVLDMFPYPSGAGLHVGHPLGYIATDIVSRYYRMKGFDVLHPMGWDAFGLPAENFAIKNKIHPRVAVEQNVKHFREQLDMFGFSYDWSREVNTTDPEYYKWTQWIFLKLYEKGLAYESDAPINWCPKDKTGLANEEVVDGKCDRCGTPVEKKNIRQWVLKITEYAEKLLADLDGLEWPQRIIDMQRNWIGKSEGARIRFDIKGSKRRVEVFTTRPDTLFGVTYMVLAPEHDLVKEITSDLQKDSVADYLAKIKNETEIERTNATREKTGVFTGAYAINPLNDEEIPIWISDYVLASYGTGAIMAVPAHDERDFAFAKKFDLSIKQVIAKDGMAHQLEEAYVDDGVLVNSGDFNDLNVEDGKKNIVKKLSELGVGELTTQYKLRDWIFSRQRYWGEPIPVIHCEKCGVVPVPEKDLPVALPDVEKYEPTGTGESPLATIEDWVTTACPNCGGKAKRETNTMPQWAGSCWYFLRFCDPHNKEEAFSKEAMKKWMPVDIYVGGAEHAVLHLLYARFWVKVLHDAGYLDFKEPFKNLRNQGLILGPDGFKMSKSKGNVVNPDDVIKEYGADTLRMYEMFMGPFEIEKPWDTKGIVGVYRFLQKTWTLLDIEAGETSREVQGLLAKTIKKVTQDIENFQFNTAVSAMMIFVNKAAKEKTLAQGDVEKFLAILNPFAPHITEEMWQQLDHKDVLVYQAWPKFNDAQTQDTEVEIAIQINGKVRARMTIQVGAKEEDVIEAAKKNEVVQKYLEDKKIVKQIYVPGRLLSIVIQ